ncbi:MULTISPECIES: chemotaxis protein [Pelosinus]|uniref:CheW domain protein n=1 Tax=Pelosinus fermentans B4 TaxID=1149862 RepID=I8RD05_9FIRM|nr:MULTISPECIES: chemotaxis protein [Pelosinus]EIW17063.1 CheW domain protein [Pelosinus fermentans B4]EIW23138.1 response regulator receiver modulated CheW protein [Pelosinus fermentans A11]OAM93820.1 response regulator receiver modulated CheW protein [Pelosinus fermentans DSM 17108]SDQ91187.1 two-component system, chemotaxis family, response regulator CheV [Pelosinus fermentans]
MGEAANAKKGILLETGTNEFEIVEFTVGKVNYGINVAKVREVINLVPITQMPNSHPYVDGIFTLRGRVMPLVNLPRCLGTEDLESSTKNIIVSELNNYFIGFLVNEVSRIHRVSWSVMEPPPNVTNSDMVVGIIKMGEKMVILLDFEKIVADINPQINIKLTTVPKSSDELKEQRKTKNIIVAEDSKMLRDLLVETLHESGYINITAYNNGKDAWDALAVLAESEAPIEESVNLLITDIEMPQMDGHHLLKRVREDRALAKLPVIIFSSLINEEMRRKGEAIGADGQVSKPEIAQLIGLLDEKCL